MDWMIALLDGFANLFLGLSHHSLEAAAHWIRCVRVFAHRSVPGCTSLSVQKWSQNPSIIYLIHENVLKTQLQYSPLYHCMMTKGFLWGSSSSTTDFSSLTSSAHEWSFWLISCELTMSTLQRPSRRSNPNEAMHGANETLRTVRKSTETESTPKAPNAPSPEVWRMHSVLRQPCPLCWSAPDTQMLQKG